jgi:hypothetical protein
VSLAAKDAARLAREVVHVVTRMLVYRRLNTIPVRDAMIFRNPLWVKVTDGRDRNGVDFRHVRPTDPDVEWGSGESTIAPSELVLRGDAGSL